MIKIKTIFIFSILLAIIIHTYGQDRIKIIHTNYTTVFDTKLKYPILVKWWNTRAKVACANRLPRKDQFQPDPKLYSETNLKYDYIKSGYDRGHMCPASDNECSGGQVLKECFYFSNMAPQTHTLNAGDWERLEKLTRELAIENDSVHIWAGSTGVKEKIKSVCVPEKCWKIIHVLRTGEWHAYIMPNNREEQTGIRSHEVKKEEIENLTGLNFYR